MSQWDIGDVVTAFGCPNTLTFSTFWTHVATTTPTTTFKKATFPEILGSSDISLQLRKNGRLWVEGGSIWWHELQHWVQNFLDDIWMIFVEKNICSILATRTGTINFCLEIGNSLSRLVGNYTAMGFLTQTMWKFWKDTHHGQQKLHFAFCRVFLDASSTPDCFWNFGPDHCGVQHFQPFPTWCQRHEIDDISGRFLEAKVSYIKKSHGFLLAESILGIIIELSPILRWPKNGSFLIVWLSRSSILPTFYNNAPKGLARLEPEINCKIIVHFDTIILRA